MSVTLYKKDTKGKIRFMETFTEGATLVQVSGLLGTDSPVRHEKVCKAKNVGRSNQTSPEAQALSEMESLINEKLDEGYFKTQREAETVKVILPMLAKSYKDESHKVDWTNAFVQPKLDGMRALGDQSLISREGKLIETLSFITEAVKQINLHLDGELYAHGETFQANMRLIKKFRPGESEKVRYHVYDHVSDRPFMTRNVELMRAIMGRGKDFPIELVPTVPVRSEEELKAAHGKFLADGYEGTILRWGNAPYKVNGRSENLLKYKDFLDLALVIKDIEPAPQRPEWGVPVFEWKGAKDDELRAGMKFSHAEREDFLKNKHQYIGKVAELRFFEYSEENVPRFPVMVGIRLDKSKGDK